MKRQVTVYESAKNGKLTVLEDVECATLGELKQLLRAKDIDCNEKEFIEGVTNTKLLSDDSKLPENIPFKGKVTNNLFINILNKDNKIKSGIYFSEMTRKELLEASKPFAEEIEETFGDNYTRVKSSDLVDFLEEQYVCEEMEREEEEPESCVCDECKVKAVLYLIDALGIKDEIIKALNLDQKSGSFFTEEDIQEFLNK